MTDRDTIQFYNEQIEAYKKISAGFDNRQLTKLITQLPKGAHVLDLGCGPGQAAGQMAAAGLVVTATDASPEMVRQAEMLDGVTAQVATFGDLDAVDEYDAVWASFSLLHAPKAEFPGHLAAIKRALRPGGLLVLSLKVGNGEERDRLNRFYAYYEVDELHRLLDTAGFNVTDVFRGHSVGMAGSNDPFVTLTAHA